MEDPGLVEGEERAGVAGEVAVVVQQELVQVEGEETFKDGFGAQSGSLVQKCFDTPQLRKVGEIAIFAHAGVIRSFLALALDSKELALKFSIDNLSITAIEALSNGQFSISFVNQSV